MATTSTTSSSQATTFNGSSTYAADLQNSITRAVGFASLPLTILQNKKNDLQSRQSAVTDLSGKFQSLQTSLSGVDKAVTSQGNTVSVGAPAVASATVTSAADAASYSLTVTNIGSSTNALSSDSLVKVTDPDVSNLDAETTLTLTVNNASFRVNNTTGTLTGLKDAINGSSANVSATIINVGSSNSPDYRLSIQSNKFAPTTISLRNSTSSLLDTISTGANVEYAINGQSSRIQSDSRAVSLAPGVTVNLQQSGSTSINVSRSATNLTTALSAFASAYNTAFDELAKSRGTTAGPLSGDSLIYSSSQSLQNLRNGGTTSTNSVNSLEDLGLSFGRDGHLTLDSSVLSGASSTTLADAAKFLGSETSSGFLQSAFNTLQTLDDSSNGIFLKSSQSITNQISAVGKKIDDTTDRITRLKTSLTAQMDKADSLIASLQQQADYFTSLFATTRANNQRGS